MDLFNLYYLLFQSSGCYRDPRFAVSAAGC